VHLVGFHYKNLYLSIIPETPTVASSDK